MYRRGTTLAALRTGYNAFYAYIPLCMSKRIRLSEDAYERLEAYKTEKESFLDVALRLSGERSLEELVEILDDEAAASVRQAVENRRERRNEAIKETAATMEDA